MAEFVYSEPNKLPDGRYFVRITKSDDSRIFEQINKAEVLSEAYCYRVPKTASLAKYDEIIINQAIKSSEAWFSKQVEEGVLRGVYESSISEDGVIEAPFTKIKGSVITLAFNADKERVELSTVAPGTQWDMLIELVGIWFLKKTFGPVWRVIQMRHSKVSTNAVPTKYMFTDDDHQEEDNIIDDI
jgi:hypothetical protein